MWKDYWYNWYVDGLLVLLKCGRFTGTIFMHTIYTASYTYPRSRWFSASPRHLFRHSSFLHIHIYRKIFEAMFFFLNIDNFVK